MATFTNLAELSRRHRSLEDELSEAKSPQVKDYSDGARKPELRRTAWWSWQDSNPQANGYEQ
jgi:hypothetical protein